MGISSAIFFSATALYVKEIQNENVSSQKVQGFTNDSGKICIFLMVYNDVVIRCLDSK